MIVFGNLINVYFPMEIMYITMDSMCSKCLNNLSLVSNERVINIQYFFCDYG